MSLVAAARLSGARSQQVFDVLLRSLSEPGTIHQLGMDDLPEVPTTLWLPLALADVDINVHVGGPDGDHWVELVRDATGARPATIEDAWIAVLDDDPSERLASIHIGSALAPEAGARVALPVATLETTASDASPVELVLAGAGVPGERSLAVGGLDSTVFEKIGRASGVFPAGFDTWLFAPDGRVAAIPRSTTVTIRRS